MKCAPYHKGSTIANPINKFIKIFAHASRTSSHDYTTYCIKSRRARLVPRDGGINDVCLQHIHNTCAIKISGCASRMVARAHAQTRGGGGAQISHRAKLYLLCLSRVANQCTIERVHAGTSTIRHSTNKPSDIVSVCVIRAAYCHQCCMCQQAACVYCALCRVSICSIDFPYSHFARKCNTYPNAVNVSLPLRIVCTMCICCCPPCSTNRPQTTRQDDERERVRQRGLRTQLNIFEVHLYVVNKSNTIMLVTEAQRHVPYITYVPKHKYTTYNTYV